jgi:uncharacterized protein YcbK (DUF882 family)
MRKWLGQSVGATAVTVAMMFSHPVRVHASERPDVGTVGTGGAQTEVMVGQPYSLHLHHLHTGETLDLTYRIGNAYLPQALAKLNHFLRDHRTMEVTEYDPKEFDLLHSVMAKLGRPNGVIEIVCGYRTPESNNFLRTRSAVTGVAEHSQHMEGHAIDIKVPGVRTLALRNAALAVDAGGVGYYPVSQFVHVDVGPVREWQFGGASRHTLRASAAHGRRHSRRHRA